MLKTTMLILALFMLSACEPDTEDAAQNAAAPVAEDTAPVVEVAAPVVAPVPLPPEMRFNGQPIDPLCVELPLGEDPLLVGPVVLDQCRKDNVIVPAQASLQPDAQGWIGYHYGYSSDDVADAEPSMAAFSKYRYIGAYNGQQIILSAQGGGGSGVFTALSAFERVGNALIRVQDYALGDRCNNGVADARIENGALVYEVNLTPPDILGLAGLEKKMIPYQDLENSAASCFATAQYKDGQFHAVRLNPDAFQDRLGWTGNYKYQACFNSLGRSMIESRMVFLTQRYLQRLSQAFIDACLSAQ